MQMLFKKAKVSLSSGFVHTFSANILILGINVLTGIITARSLGPEGRGIQAAIILWPQFLAYIFTLGLPAAVVYCGKVNRNQLPNIIGTALILSSGIGVVAAIFGVVLMPYVLKNYGREVVVFTQYLMFLTPISLLGVVINAMMQLKEDYTLYNVFRYFPPVISILTLLAFFYFFKLTPFNSVVIMSFPQIPVLFFGMVWVYKTFRPKIYMNVESYVLLMQYGFRAYGIDVIRTTADQIDRVLVIGILSPALMGYYVVALGISRILNTAQTAASITLLPKLINKSNREIINLTKRNIKSTLLLSFGMLVFLFIFGPYLIKIFYGDDFRIAISVFKILLFESLFTGISWIFSQAFIAINIPGLVTTILTVSLIIGSPVMYFLAGRYNLEGIGFGLLFISVLKLIITLYFFYFKLVLNNSEGKIEYNQA